jgi:hypothetical protein
MRSTRDVDTVAVIGVARRLVALGFGVGLVPAVAAAILVALYPMVAVTWSGPLLATVGAGAALTLAAAISLRGSGVVVRAAALLVLNLLLWVADVFVVPLGLAEWFMVIAFTFPATAVALLVRAGRRDARAATDTSIGTAPA